MRIAHFVHRYPPALGGAEVYFARLSRYLAAQGDSVRVFTTNALDLEAFWSSRARTLPAGVEDDQGVEVHRCFLRHWPGQRYMLKAMSLIPWPFLQTLTVSCNPIVPQMWQDAGRKQELDIVHAAAFPYGFPISCALRLARRNRVPFVLTPFLHLGDPRDPADRTRRGYLSPGMKYLLYKADRIMVQTEIERDALLREGLPGERLVLQGMGVEPAECTGGDRQGARKRWNLAPDEVVVGHLANKSVEKGTVDLLRGSELVWRENRKMRLLLAGPEMPNFLRHWQEEPPTGPVTRLGVLTEVEKRDFYAACDFFALPSRSDSFGLVFLEAWANGLPCIGYRAGGVAGVIRHGEDGLLVDCGDVENLARALLRLTENATERREFGESGRQKVLRDHRWEPKLALVRQVYQELVGSGSAGS